MIKSGCQIIYHLLSRTQRAMEIEGGSSMAWRNFPPVLDSSSASRRRRRPQQLMVNNKQKQEVRLSAN